MSISKRQVKFFTPQKVYSGYLDVNTDDMRTIDLLNSANLYWKNPDEKSFNDSILLNKADVTIEGGKLLGSFPQLQIRLSDIIFFTDDEETTGHFSEKLRASVLTQRSGEKASTARILTRMRGDSFFIITGLFKGLFKSKSKHRYFPLSQATVNALVRTGDSWKNQELVNGKFIGLSTENIEACAFY